MSRVIDKTTKGLQYLLQWRPISFEPTTFRASQNFVSDEFFLLFFPLFSCPFLFLSLVLPFHCHDCHRETRHPRLRRESRSPEIVVLVRPRIMQWAGMLASDDAVVAGCSGSAGSSSGSVRLLSCSQDLPWSEASLAVARLFLSQHRSSTQCSSHVTVTFRRLLFLWRGGAYAFILS